MPFDSREYEYADVKVSMLGTSLTGLRGLTYKYSQQKDVVYAQGNEPKAIQRMNKRYDGQLMLLKSDFDKLNRAARVAGFKNIVDVPGHLITITVAYQKEASTSLSVDSLINLEFTDFEDGMKQGDAFKEVVLPFLFLGLKQV